MQLVVPAIRIKEVHDGGSGVHFGINKMLSKVRERFYWVCYREDVESRCKKCRTCAAVKELKIKARGPMQPQNVGSPFGRTAGEVAGPLPVTEERNKDTKKVNGYDDGLQEKLPSVNEMVRHKIRVASDRMKTRYDLKCNSEEFQAGDLIWLHNPRRRNGRCPKLLLDWEGPYTVVTRIKDVGYQIRQGSKTKIKIVTWAAS